MGHTARVLNRFTTFAKAGVVSLAFPFNRLNVSLRQSNLDTDPTSFNRLNGTSRASADLPFNRLNARSLRQSNVDTDPASFNRLNEASRASAALPLNRLIAEVGGADPSPDPKSFNRLNTSRESTSPPRQRFNRLNTRSPITQKKTPPLPGAFLFFTYAPHLPRPKRSKPRKKAWSWRSRP